MHDISEFRAYWGGSKFENVDIGRTIARPDTHGYQNGTVSHSLDSENLMYLVMLHLIALLEQLVGKNYTL